MQLCEDRCNVNDFAFDVVVSPRTGYDTCESVLNALKFYKIGLGRAGEDGVAIVQSRANDAARDRVRDVVW